MYILGLHISGWTTSAALFEDSRLVAACPEERLNRQKYSRAFPSLAAEYCLEQASISWRDVDYIAVGWNPGVNVAARYRGGFSERLRFAGEWLYSIPNHIFGKHLKTSILNTEQIFTLPDSQIRFQYLDHHSSHAAAAFYPSPFETSAILTVDGYGERTSSAWKSGIGNKIHSHRETPFPQSIGSFYSAITEYLGYSPDGDEWKVMGMSAYGDPASYRAEISQLYTLLPDGDYALDLQYFNHFNFDTDQLYSPRLEGLLGAPRAEEEPLQQRHYDLAASAQEALEHMIYHCLRHLHATTGEDRLCLSGGTIMNSVLNGKVIENTPFEEVYVPFSPDDTGNAIGAPLLLYFDILGHPRESVECDHAYVGPEFTNEEIEEALNKYGVSFRRSTSVEIETARALANGKVVGWFQGKMEFGQRALGNRSILADPRDPAMKDRVNSAVKYREAYRPFAPSILSEYAHEYFEMEDQTTVPFMERVYRIRPEKRTQIGAVVHADGTGRLQTVTAETNPRYHSLISQFHSITGVPVVLNTSFNVKGEPVVCSPADALRTFYTSGIELLVMGDYVVAK